MAASVNGVAASRASPVQTVYLGFFGVFCLLRMLDGYQQLSFLNVQRLFTSSSLAFVFQANSDNSRMPSLPVQDPPQPRSLTDLFVSFTLLALQGFGGVLAVVQRELVEKKRWMTREEFIEDWAVAQIMPGPNVVNLSLMIGGRYFGLKGAMAALAGMLSVPLILVLLLALVYAQFADHPGVAGALRGMGAVAAGLIAATGLKLFGALLKNVLGLRLCIAFGVMCFVAIALLRWPLFYVLFGLGSVACTLAYRKLKP
ncbi:Chromate transporter [Polaromonas sp. CG9_12]|nr:Chromate transporter [Polaromonas sp. CG9_12]